MSSLLSAELSATCNALGTLNKKTGKYMIDDFTLNTVKDLIRYLRRDGEDHEIRRHFGQTKVLQTDLLPMLIDHWENEELFDVTLRLIVNLTNPALLLYREEVPVERTARHNYLQILSHLQSYKEDAFTKVETWQIFAKKLGKVLEIDWSERDEDTGLVIERILILIRNVLHVPADLDKERRPENDASVHDQVLWALNQAGILDIILYMSSENEKQYFMHIIEIISHLLREQNPTSLADSALQRSVDEKLRDDQQLLTLRMTENKDRMNKIKHYSATRHSRFGGTYVVQNMKSISDNELISLKPLNKISNLDFNGSRKSRLVRPKNRRPVESGTMERRSAFAIRLFLKEFCIEFLNSAYNPLMRHVRDVLARAAAQQHDDSYYLWAVKFFMEFNRGHDFQVGLVSETMSVPMFHYVQQQTEKYYDMIKVERKKFSNWVRRLHLAVRAYKELLLSVVRMEQGSAELRDAAKVFKTNIFYVLEYREFVLSIFLNYDENKMPRSYLVDLIETVHLFLKMLEHYCKKTGLVVQKKVRKKSNAKKRKPKPRARVPSPPSWEELRPQLSAVLSSGCALRPPPCDFADAHDDLQKERCMRNIQQSMRQHKYEHAVGTLRAAREVWPEGGVFGTDGMREEEELDMLQCVYDADLGLDTQIQDEVIHENSEDEDNEDEEDEDRTTSVVETDFDFQDFVLRFCSYRVVSSCASVLERYESNPPHANHCALKMLHRVAVDCCRPAMLFQATLFLTFQKILHNPLAHFKELEKFAIFILRKFTEVASKSNKAFIELLFWKSSKDAVEIQHGYDVYEDPRSKVGSGGWSEEQEHELRALYDENQTNPATDQDVIDWILENLIDQTRTRRSVIKKLREMGLVFNAPTKRSNKSRKEKLPTHFSEEENQALTDLWTQYGESEDPMTAIVARMPRSRPRRQYVERLVELGLVEDRKQCRRKRTRNKTNGNSSDSELSKSDSEGHSTSVPPSLKTNPRKKLTKRKETNKKSAVSVEMSARDVAALLVRAVDSGYTEALNWLSENLEEVALDQEAEGFDPSAEGTPLVPITRACVQAMRDDLFTRVLRSVGMVPPDNEQETYWRIPSSLHYDTIRTRRDIINRAVNRELITDHTSALTERDKEGNIDERDSTTAPTERHKENNIDERDSTTAPTERHKENNIDKRDSTTAPTERHKEDIIDERDSTSDDELFDNLRKITNNAHNDNIKNKRRKRTRSDRSLGDQHTPMERIEEENHEEEEEDILSFAKKTLHTDEQRDSDASEGAAPRKRRKMRVLSDSE